MSEEKRKGLLHSRWLQLTLALCTAVILYLFLAHIDLLLKALGAIAGFIMPVIIGVVIAYVMDPLVKVYERYVFKKLKSPGNIKRLSVTCAVATVILLFALLMVVLVPQLVSNITTFVANIDTYMAQLQKMLNGLAGSTSGSKIDLSGFTDSFNDLFDKTSSKITDNIDNIINTSVSIGTGVFNFIISFILAIYFLLDKNRLIKGCKKLMNVLMSEKHFEKSLNFLSRCNGILIRYIACDILDGIVIGILNAIFMFITGMPYIGLVSIVVGVTNLAPTFGPIVGCVIGAFILLLINPWYAVAFVIFTICLQTFDGYIFKPKLFGSSLGVSSIWILICIIVGGRIFGVWGILLAIPFAAISDFIYHESVIPALEARHRRREEEFQSSSAADRDRSMIQKLKDGFSEAVSDHDEDLQDDEQNE